MTGLRERQKVARQQRILAAARVQFSTTDFRDVTIEAIASAAELSPMTVFNYYGSKGGLLLALVAESDRHLIEKINIVLAREHDTAADAVVRFFGTITDHALFYLPRRAWRHVVATAIIEGDSQFGRGFVQLERKLISLLAVLLRRLKGHGQLRPDVDHDTAARVLYNVQNAHVVQYVADSDLDGGAVASLMEADLRFVVNNLTPRDA